MSVIAPARTKSASTPIGTGALHQALEASSAASALRSFCQNTGMQPDEVSADGVHLDVLRVFDALRSRGYQVGQPQRPQHQPKKGFTAWWVHVRKSGAEFALGFYTADAP